MIKELRLSYIMNFIILVAMGIPVFIFARNTIKNSNQALVDEITNSQQHSSELAIFSAQNYFHSMALNISHLATDEKFINAVKDSNQAIIDAKLAQKFSNTGTFNISHLFITNRNNETISEVFAPNEGSGKKLSTYKYPRFFDKKLKLLVEDDQSFYLVISFPVIDNNSGLVLASLSAAIYVGPNSHFLTTVANNGHAENIFVVHKNEVLARLKPYDIGDIESKFKKSNIYIDDYTIFTSFNAFFENFSEIKIILKTDNMSLKSLKENQAAQQQYAYLIVSLLTLMFYVLFKLLVTNPIKELMDFSKNPSETIKSQHHFSRIIEFKVLYNTIRNSFRKIHDINSNLEKIVDQRTEELQDKNELLNSKMDELVRLQKSMVAQEKLASIGTVMAGISHELKNPLNIIINSAKILKAKSSGMSEEDPKQAKIKNIVDELSDVIHKHSTRANYTIESMLSKSRGKDLSSKETDLIDLIESSFNLINKSQNYEEEVKVDFFIKHRENIVADVYPSELSQVFINIFDNAFYALRKRINQMEPALRSDFKPSIDGEAFILNNSIYIKIKDNGSGIPEEYIEKIFNSFETSKPPGSGTGLGLSLSREIMTKHQGDISVISKLGEFTEFTFRLPVTK